MKKLYGILGLIAGLFIGYAFIANAAPITPPTGGGTGIGTTTSANNGLCLTQTGVFTYGFATCGSGGGSFTTTTINNGQYLVFHIVGDGTTITSTASGATTTFSLINPGYLVNSNNLSDVSSSTVALANLGGLSVSNVSGQSGYDAQFTATSTLGDSNIFNSSTYVGIGTTYPNAALDVEGSGGTILNAGMLNISNNTDGFGNTEGSSTLAWDANDYLTASATKAFALTSTTIQISTTTGLTPSGFVGINNKEIAYYGSYTSNGASSTLNNMVRGLFGTTKQTATTSFYAVPIVLANNSSSVPFYNVMCNIASTCVTGIGGLAQYGYILYVSGNTDINGLLVVNGGLSGVTTLSTSGAVSLATGGASVGIGTASPANTLDVKGSGDFQSQLAVGTTSTSTATLNVYGSFQLASSSMLITPSIGGAITTSGCDSATTSVSGYGLNASTTAFVTQPEIYVGPVSQIYTVLTNSTTITTYVCADITLTPSSTPYVVKIIK